MFAEQPVHALWGEPVDAAHDDANAGGVDLRVRHQRLGDAKIEQLHVTARRRGVAQKDVARFHVTVEHAPVVELGQRLGDLGEDAHDLGEAQVWQRRGEVTAAEAFHRERDVSGALVLDDVPYPHQPGDLKALQEARLFDESLGDSGAAIRRSLGEGPMQDLQRDLAVGPLMDREPHRREAAGAQLRDEAVRPDATGRGRSKRRDGDHPPSPSSFGTNRRWGAKVSFLPEGRRWPGFPC